MKQIIFTLLGLFSLVIVSAQNSAIQVIGQKNDTVILKIENPEGNIQWQNSTDNKSWQNITGETSDIYKANMTLEFYYRAKIIGIACGEKITNSIQVSSTNLAVETLSPAEIENLIVQCYLPVRAWYGKEVGCDFTEVGTDIFTYAFDNRAVNMTRYVFSKMDETPIRIAAVWIELYRGLINCNAAVHFIQKSDLSSADKTKKVAETRFLRAFYLWHIAETWGGAAYTTDFEPFDQNSLRAVPIDTMYKQIYSDLTYAEANLPDFAGVNTTLTKMAAKAFFARIYLTRKNYAQALIYSKKVLESGNFILSTNISKVWNITTRQNPEFIYSLDNTSYPDPLNEYISYIYDYSNITSHLILRDGGNQNPLNFEIRYESTGWGILRDINNGRGFLRYMPTKFLIDLYSQPMDKRFNAYFKNTWYSNDTISIPRWSSYYYIDGIQYQTPALKKGTRMFNLGDTCIYFSKTPVASSQKAKFSTTNNYSFDPVSGYLIFDINDFYKSTATTTDSILDRSLFFPISQKFRDTTRADIMATYSSRNVPLLRTAEMYLIAAEAAYMNGDVNLAYDYLHALADSRATTGDGAALLAEYGVNTGADITIDFILDERARELAGEQLRWFDLKRTGKLVERVVSHNSDAAKNIKEYHNLRLIPPLNNELRYIFKCLIQNPGYE